MITLLAGSFWITACIQKPLNIAAAKCEPASGALFFWIEPEESLRPGQARFLIPYKADRPGAQEQLSSACLTNIRVTPEEAGFIKPGPLGDYILDVSSTAPAGLTASVEADYPGGHIRSNFRIFDPISNPLVGQLWVQQTEGCAEGTAIQELIFSANGEFSVIWDFFEWRKDCEGRYEFHPETGTLELIQTFGCSSETGLTSGQIEVEGNEFFLKTASFGTGPGRDQICQAPFVGN